MRHASVALLLLFLLHAAWARASSQLDQDFEDGLIDLETATLHRACSLFDPDNLPERYRDKAQTATCGTPLAIQIREDLRRLSPLAAARIFRISSRRSQAFSLVTTTGRFRIHYDTNPSNRSAVDSKDEDRSGVPDYVETVAATFDSVWRLTIDGLGYHPPLSDRGAGGGNEYDIYVVDLGSTNAYGFTYPEEPGSDGQTSTSYIEIDNDYRGGVYSTSPTNGLDALRVTAAHEFLHAIQFAYYDRQDGVWWQEATATWMEDVAYTGINDYYQYLRSFFSDPTISLDRQNSSMDYHIFGATIFPHFLSERYEPAVVRRSWEGFAAQRSADIGGIDRAIRQSGNPGGLDSAMREFSVWNYFTGRRHRNAYYSEGGAYPEMPAKLLNVSGGTNEAPIDHLGADYLKVDPQGRPGGIRLQFQLDGRADWGLTFLLIAGDAVEVREAGEALRLVLFDWQRYEEIVAIPHVVSRNGVGFRYSCTGTYDSAMTEQPPPERFVLNPVYPNPFRPASGQAATISFELPYASANSSIVIYSMSGQKIREIPLGNLQAFSYTDNAAWHSWDGRDQAGRAVSPGIYFYRLSAGRFSGAGKIVLLSPDRP